MDRVLNGHRNVMVLFFDPRCPDCRNFAQVYRDAFDKHPFTVFFASLNAAHFEELRVGFGSAASVDSVQRHRSPRAEVLRRGRPAGGRAGYPREDGGGNCGLAPSAARRADAEKEGEGDEDGHGGDREGGGREGGTGVVIWKGDCWRVNGLLHTAFNLTWTHLPFFEKR